MKNIKKMICMSTLYAVGVASILGSADNTPTVRTHVFWGKDGVSFEDAKTYYAQCKYDVGIEKFEARAERDELIHACMEKEGFRQIRYTEE